MSVVTLIAFSIVFMGCATNRDTVSTVNQTSTEVKPGLQEKDSTEPSQIIYCSEDWENLDKQKDLITEVLSTRQDGALQYEPHGVYSLYDESFKTYTFDAPNDFYQVVMMNNDETFPFIIHNTGNHGVSFQSIVYKEGKFVGLTSNYGVHTLRHTCATILYKSGIDIKVIQELLGHSQVKTTEIYTHLYDKDVEKEMLNHPLAKFKIKNALCYIS